MRLEILRDPLWNNIRVDEPTLRLVDTEVFQRLRYVRQLGLAYLVYPGATHTRFEHALGTYHLARGTLALMAERRGLGDSDAEEHAVVRAAALLHDVGHYPFSHALEEIGQLHHEDVARPLITEGAVAALLSSRVGEDAPARVFELIRGRSASPLQGLISGSLDLVKTGENVYFVDVLAGNQALAIRALGQRWQTTVVGETLNQFSVYLALLSLSELTGQVAGLLIAPRSC